jgi:hypothetical protein
MAAQFDDVKLPELHQRSLLILVHSGLYGCRVIQRFDPDPYDPPLRDKDADFIVELVPTDSDDRVEGLTDIPWVTL